MKKKTNVGSGTKKVDSLDKIIIYTDDKGNTELRADVEKETVWATLDQIATLFGRDKSVISRHLRNIFITNELDRLRTVAVNATVQMEGGREIERNLEYYNLDAILSVGYRVNSKQATRFRIWATKILRDYVVNGYSLNNRLITKSSEKLEGLQEAITLIESTANPGKLKGKITIKLTKNLEAK